MTTCKQDENKPTSKHTTAKPQHQKQRTLTRQTPIDMPKGRREISQDPNPKQRSKATREHRERWGSSLPREESPNWQSVVKGQNRNQTHTSNTKWTEHVVFIFGHTHIHIHAYIHVYVSVSNNTHMYIYFYNTKDTMNLRGSSRKEREEEI